MSEVHIQWELLQEKLGQLAQVLSHLHPHHFLLDLGLCYGVASGEAA